MQKTKRNKNKIAVCLLSGALLAANIVASASGASASASGETAAHYCDDGYGGQGTHVSTTYTVEYDYAVEHNEYRVGCAPSLCGSGSNFSNDCTAIAGLNVCVYYDRYYPDLIPNYTPGISVGSIYRYLPSRGSAAINTVHSTLYSYMGVNSAGWGASEDGFKSGLARYVTEQGLSVSYSAMYQSGQTVNLARMRQMVGDKQVAVLFLSGYNFVYGFNVTDTARTVYQESADAGHMMMVYGYFTVDYYKNGQLFLTETYLEASSCFGTSDQGYIKMDSYGTIDNALVVAIG